MAELVEIAEVVDETALARTKPEERRRFRRDTRRRDRAIAWTIVVLVTVITLFPFYWALRTALSTQRELLANPANLLPVGFTWDSFRQVLGMETTESAIASGASARTFNFWRYLGNTILVSSVVAIGQITFSSMAAYAFSRLRFPWRDQIFMIFLAAMMVPGIVLLIPNFVLIYDLGWINTYQGIIAPAFFKSPYAIFFLRQFFLGINREIEEAAYLDGAGYFEVFWRLIIPMSQGPIITPVNHRLHHPMERLPLAIPRRPGRKCPRPHRGPQCLPGPDATGLTRLARTHGRDVARQPAGDGDLSPAWQANLAIPAVHGHQVTSQPDVFRWPVPGQLRRLRVRHAYGGRINDRLTVFPQGLTDC